MRLFFSPCAADKAAICCPSCSFFLPCAEQAVPVVHPAGRSSTWSWRPILCRTYPRMRPGKNVHAVVDFRVTSPGVIWLVACGWAERRHGVGCVPVHSVSCVPRILWLEFERFVFPRMFNRIPVAIFRPQGCCHSGDVEFGCSGGRLGASRRRQR